MMTRLTDSLKRMAGTWLSLFQTRLELLANEMEEERQRFQQILLYGVIALLFFVLAIMLLALRRGDFAGLKQQGWHVLCLHPATACLTRHFSCQTHDTGVEL